MHELQEAAQNEGYQDLENEEPAVNEMENAVPVTQATKTASVLPKV